MLQRCSGDSHKSGSTIASLYAKQGGTATARNSLRAEECKAQCQRTGRAGPKDTEKRKQPLPKNNATTSADAPFPSPTSKIDRLLSCLDSSSVTAAASFLASSAAPSSSTCSWYETNNFDSVGNLTL